MKENIKIGDLISPVSLHSTQPNQAPHVEKMLPYDHRRDEGIKIGIDENEDVWILNGHNRAAAASMEGVKVKVGEIEEVSSSDMWNLID